MTSRRFESVVAASVAWLARGAAALFLFVALALLKESLPALSHASLWGFLSGSDWRPTLPDPILGILPMIAGTLAVSFGALVVALPVGVGAALALCVAGPRTRAVVRPVIDVLAGIPSVVYGFLGLLTIVRGFERLGMASGESVLAASLVLGAMILPFIVAVCEEAMRDAVARYGAASLALGVGRDEMLLRLVLPASRRAILAAAVSGLARALGETMAVMMVAGNSPLFPTLLGRTETIPSLIALEMGCAEVGSLHVSGLYAAGFVLTVLLFALSLVAHRLQRRAGR